MTAQATRPVKIRRPKPGSKAEAILTLSATTPATNIEIAESVDTHKSHVTHVLKRYGIQRNTAESYKTHRAEILAGLQDKILQTVNLADIKEASVLQRVTAAGILYDKERLERGGAPDQSRPLVVVVRGDNARVQVVDNSGTRDLQNDPQAITIGYDETSHDNG